MYVRCEQTSPIPRICCIRLKKCVYIDVKVYRNHLFLYYWYLYLYIVFCDDIRLNMKFNSQKPIHVQISNNV